MKFASVGVFVVVLVLILTSAVLFDRYDTRRVELDKHYANQGYEQLWGEVKDAVMVQSDRMAW